MKVLFITNVPAPYRVEFFNELSIYCDLTVLYERHTAKDRDKNWISHSNKVYNEVFLEGFNIGTDGALCFGISKWLKKNIFDLIVVGGYSTPTGMLAIQLMKMRKIPFVLNCDGGFIKQDNKIKYIIKKYFISSAKYWLSTGKITNEYLEYYGAKTENIFIYPFTSIREEDILDSPLTIEEKIALRDKLEIPYDKIAISVGRFIPIKGYDKLIEKWKDVDKEWTLILIGSGEEEEKLKHIISKNQLNNIKIIEFKQKEALKEYYLAADIFLLPTQGDVWGLVVNEAIGYGLPVITTNRCIAGIELIKNGINGKIINLEDKHKIDINKEINLLGNIPNMSKESLEIAKLYTIENMAKTHFNIFKKIIKGINKG